MAGKTGAQRGITAAVLKYALDNPGTYMRVEDVAHMLEATEQQVANAFAYVLREDKLPGLQAVQKGHVWLYEPEGGDDGAERWEVVRRTAQGAQAVLEDGEGNLWVAKPVVL